MIRAKFTVQETHEMSYPAGAKTVILRPQYDTSIPEDRRFSEATPSGELTMFVTNPAALEQLQRGRCFYLDFTPAE